MPSRFIKIFLTITILAAFWPVFSFAQLVNPLDFSSAFSNELNVNIVPTYPKPYENINIDLTLYSGDLDSAKINWYLNGTNVLSGTGEKNYSFRTGAAGKVENFEIRVTLADGVSFSKTFTINPSDVRLLWEANSYVPPFYKGKALHSQHGSLKIVAMPEFVRNGAPVPASNLIYNWSNGQETYPSQSGYGRGVLIINGSLIGRDEKVSVVVTDPVSGMKTQGWADIRTSRPEILFYENSPYYGNLFDQAVGAIDLTNEEVQVIAYPFFFSNEEGDNIEYEWRLNNQTIPSLYNLRSAIFRKPEGEGGQSIISISVKNINKFMQQAESRFIMKWGE